MCLFTLPASAGYSSCLSRRDGFEGHFRYCNWCRYLYLKNISTWPHLRCGDVMLVWRKQILIKTVCATVLCTIIMVHKGTRAVLTGRSTVSGFDLAWLSSLSSQCLCLWSSWCYIDINFFCLHPSLYLLVS